MRKRVIFLVTKAEHPKPCILISKKFARFSPLLIFIFSSEYLRSSRSDACSDTHGKVRTRRNQERLRIGENLDCDTFSRKVVFTKLLDMAILHSDTKLQLPSATRCLARTVTMRPLYPTRSHFEIVLL